MTRLVWDQSGARLYEAGVDHGVLYIPDASGVYTNGYSWNGLTTVTESPSGAEANAQYADNIKYLNLVSAEEFGGTIEAFTYPPEFAQCDGTAIVSGGISIGQQARKSFGLSYRTLQGNDIDGTAYGYKLHLIYGALAAPSEKAYATINDSPEAITFSWEITTSPVQVTGYKPAAQLTVNSKLVTPANLTALEDILYGTAGLGPRLPLPDEVLGMFTGALVDVIPNAPTYVSATKTITIVPTTGVVYKVGNVAKTGSFVITEDTIVKATPTSGYKFPAVSDDDWFFKF